MKERSEPVLPARDLDEARAFYAKLGFTAWFGQDSRWSTYEIVSRGNLVLHFFCDSKLNPGENCSGCYLRVADADAFHCDCAVLELKADGIPRVTQPRNEEWGMREFVLVDPSGNLLRIGHELGDGR